MKKFKKIISPSNILICAIIAICIFTVGANPDFCLNIFGKTAVFSASTVLPAFSSADSGTEVNEQQSTETQAEKVKPYIEATQETATASKVSSAFTDTPADIKKLMEKYKKSSSKDKKDGAVTECYYKTTGVTDSYSNVRIKNVNDTKIDVKDILENQKPDMKIKDPSKPSVLIFHTHTTERFQILDRGFYARGYTSRSENPNENIVRVGDEITTELEKAGFTVIHDKTVYDKEYNGAYYRSEEQMKKYLKKYPSIQVILDIHRDAIEYNNGTKIKPVATVAGKKAAQMMIITGCQEKGNGITGFDDWRYNLTFAVHLQEQIESMFGGLTRPTYFCPRVYNMNTGHCNLLIEIGSDGNTLEEAVYAGKCLGNALGELMKKYTAK